MDNVEQAVGQIRAAVMAEAVNGVKCPCCDQNVKVYERSITGSMAKALILLAKATPQSGPDWVHVPTLLRRNGIGEKHVAMLRYWGLIVQKPGERDDGSKATGWWMITDLGVQFIRGTATVPKKIRVYNGQFLGPVPGAGVVGINDVMGKVFNYREATK